MGKSKEAILYLEKAMEKAPKLLKRFIELNPVHSSKSTGGDILAKFKRNKSF